MIKKEYLAAIVAIAVAVAAVAIFAMGGGNEDGKDDEKESLLPVDKLRTDLRIRQDHVRRVVYHALSLQRESQRDRR